MILFFRTWLFRVHGFSRTTFFVSILVKVFNKEPTTFETFVYLLGSKSEAKAYTFTIQFSSQDEVIVKVLNYYRVTKLFLENHQILYFFAKNF